MVKRWSGLLLLLFVLACVAVEIQRCHSLEEEVEEDIMHPVEDGLEEEDELEDLDEGLEDVTGDPGSYSSSADVIAASKVANVNDQDVERVIAKYEFVLLLGYAPWCTQSQELLPEFAAASVQLSDLGNPTVLAKLDAVNNPSAAARYEIRGYPTLILFVNGSRDDYSGGHSREEIVLWVLKKTGSAITTILSKESAESFLSRNVTAVIGYFDNLDSPEHDAFAAAAKLDLDTEFVSTTNIEVTLLLSQGAPISSPPFIALCKQEPERLSVFGGSFNAEEIDSFVKLNKYPLVTVLNSKNANLVYASPLKLHLLLFAESKDDYVKPLYLEAARHFKGKVMFLAIDLKDEEFSKPMLAVYGLDTAKPVVAGLDNEDGSRYLLESDLTVESLKDFAADFYARKLPLYYKSDPVPAQNDGLVKIVVGKTVEKIVMDDTKDVFLFVHAPWCATCEKVGRNFEKLAKHVQDVSSLVMAKYDANSNEHPILMEVPNYPSLLLYPAGRKSSSPLLAKSQGSWKKLLAFLKENVAIPFPLKDGNDVADSEGRKETHIDEPAVTQQQQPELKDEL